MKKTGLGEGAPAEVDFDRLWQLALEPTIRALGYDPVRADRDVGASIIREMIERLALSDLVVADLSIPNANVFYEVGVRHAARKSGCVLIGARWSRQPFDVDQMRTVRYELTEGSVTEEEALRVREMLEREIPRYAHSPTPCFELEGFPELSLERAQSFREFVRRVQGFQARTTEVRLIPDKERRKERIQELVEGASDVSPALVPELLALVRDYGTGDWQAVIDFVERLPPEQQRQAYVEEQRCLAMSKLGYHEKAVAALTMLIERHGETPERLGLIGGRYKSLWMRARESGNEQLARRHLHRSIQHYERGMWLDLNEYYCASNLPRLLRHRGAAGDEGEAQRIAHLVLLACERARRAGSRAEWLPLTLLVAAFDSGDADQVDTIVERLDAEGTVAWAATSALKDVDTALTLLPDTASKARLREQRGRLAALAQQSG